MNTAVQYLQAKPERRPLAQVEVLVLFSPALQSGGPVKGAYPANCEQARLTLDVYGTRGHSELDGRPILENLRLEANGEDQQELLGEAMVERIQKYVLEVI